MRSFARARSSSRRAPPKAASKPCCGDRVQQRHRLQAVARGPRPRLLDGAARVDRLLHARHDQQLSQLRHAAVAELDHLGEVVAGVHVHQRERERRRAERLLGEAQQHDRVLAAAEQQHRSLEFRGDLAHHVDRLALQRPQVTQLWALRDAHHAHCARLAVHASSPFIALPRRRANHTRSCPCPPSGPRGRCPAGCTARSRSRRTPGRAAGCMAARARGCAATGPSRSSAPAGCTSTGRAVSSCSISSACARVAPARGGCR